MHNNCCTNPSWMKAIDKGAMEWQWCATNGGDAMRDVRRRVDICRAKMSKWGGTAKTIGLSRGDVHQVTSSASCWANDWWEANSLQNRLRRRRNYLCMHRLLDKSTSFSFSSEYQILILWPYQPYGFLLDHSDSLMSEAILLLPSGRVGSVIYPLGNVSMVERTLRNFVGGERIANQISYKHDYCVDLITYVSIGF